MTLPANAIKARVGTVGPVNPRIIARIGGLAKRGKTHWALTGPAPMAFFDLNDRTEMVVNKFMTRKDIYMLRYRVSRRADPKDWVKQWDQLSADWEQLAKGDDVRSFVLDTDTDLWELRRLAAFGRDSANPQHYAPLNRDMRQLFEMINNTDKNLFVISEMKKEYEDYTDAKGDRKSAWTGGYEMAGWSGTDFKVQVNLEALYDPETREFGTRVLNCGINPAINHIDYWGDMSCVPYLGTELYPGTDMEYWVGQETG